MWQSALSSQVQLTVALSLPITLDTIHQRLKPLQLVDTCQLCTFSMNGLNTKSLLHHAGSQLSKQCYLLHMHNCHVITISCDFYLFIESEDTVLSCQVALYLYSLTNLKRAAPYSSSPPMITEL